MQGFANLRRTETNRKATSRRSLRRFLLYKFFQQHWNIGVIESPIHVVAGLNGKDQQSKALRSAHWASKKRHSFRADPFITKLDSSGNKARIFFEHLDWQVGRGQIYSTVFDRRQKIFSDEILIMDREHHLSYPYIWHVDGESGIVPEQAEAGTLSWYPFDDNGTIGPKRTIMADTPLIDSSIFFWQDRYWMFAGQADGAENSSLNLYFSEHQLGPWQEHPKNPVKLGKANSRNAGTPFIYKNRLYRPAQDCSDYYGSGVVINEIVRLSEMDFAEVAVSDIRPISDSPYDFGLHTISGHDDLTVIDAAKLTSKIHNTLDGLSKYLQ